MREEESPDSRQFSTFWQTYLLVVFQKFLLKAIPTKNIWQYWYRKLMSKSVFSASFLRTEVKRLLKKTDSNWILLINYFSILSLTSTLLMNKTKFWQMNKTIGNTAFCIHVLFQTELSLHPPIVETKVTSNLLKLRQLFPINYIMLF